MTSQVFYRKWRPQTLAEVAGQEHVTRTLLNALGTGRVAHAYLFCGPRGTGKTSTGRILAKAVNCMMNGKGEPCNSCDICRSVTEGRALDLIEIDAASNRGIDDIRELRERVRLAPNVARYKVYIIDEAHMLTPDASNALLKTLEEPPPHAIFILATTEPHKLLTTILSRCQRFDFRRLSHEAVVSKLAHICENEGISIERKGLSLIAKSVSGSLRDAENLLQQLLVYYGDTIDLHQVEEMLGVTSDFRVKELVQHMANRDVAGGLATINSVVDDGMDLVQYNRGLVEYLRSMLLASTGAEASLDLGAEDTAEVRRLAEGVPVSHILRALRLFGQIDFRSRDYSPLPLEMALVESMMTEEASGEPPKAPVRRGDSTAPRPRVAAIEEPAPAGKPEAPPETPVRPLEAPPATHEALAPAEPSAEPLDPELARIRAEWADFIDSLRGVGSSGNLDAYLRDACEPAEIEGDTLVVAFYYSFHKERVDDVKYRRMVEQRLAERLGKAMKIRCILRPHKKAVAKQKAIDNPVVRAAIEMGGRVTSVEEYPEATGGQE